MGYTGKTGNSGIKGNTVNTGQPGNKRNTKHGMLFIYVSLTLKYICAQPEDRIFFF